MRPIPTIEDPERYIDSAFVDSAFIELKSCDLWDVKMLYPILNMDHAEENCFVRKEMYERLVKAAGNLPDGYRFRIWDAWRPFALQHELFEKYSVDIIRDFHLEELPEEKRRAAICKFVSDPVPDTKVPPAHTTGGAIDLTILDPEGRELPMGCGFDAFTDKTYAAYFEASEHVQGAEDEQIRENRRLLYYTMIDAGFTNLPSEWWHYDYGDRFWAYYMRKPAIYEGVFTREEIHG